MIQQIEVTIRAPVHPTESTDRVIEAIHNLFPTAVIEQREDEVVGTAHSLSHLGELFSQREVLATARKQFKTHSGREGFSFTLKKQPAVVGVPTFAVGEPSELGELAVDVHVTEPDVDTVIDQIVPPTDEDGRVIHPDE